MQAIILAAGKGSRLGSLTKKQPKCMLEVANKKIIDYILESVSIPEINKITIVIGHCGDVLKKYIEEKYCSLNIAFIDESELIKEPHNNIYSLLTAKEQLKKDDSIIIESDIIYDSYIIKDLVNNIIPNQAVVSIYSKVLGSGTCVTLDDNNKLTHMFMCDEDNRDFNLYKTVNIYKFSKEFLQDKYLPLLENWVNENGYDDYYESPLYPIISNYDIIGYVTDCNSWVEIDNQDDLLRANLLKSKGEDKYRLLKQLHGGYYKVPEIIDCYYLKNCFFNLCSYIQSNDIYDLIADYPITNKQSIKHLSELFDIDEDNILIGNGASELIKLLGDYFSDKRCSMPVISFPEYNRFFKKLKIDNTDWTSEILIVPHPNNPLGDFNVDTFDKILTQREVMGKFTIIDESFLDFNIDIKSYLTQAYLDKYKKLIIIKSLGKSYSLNGLRVGMLACGDKELVKELGDKLPAWNINAITEKILSKLYLHKEAYQQSLRDIYYEGERFLKDLNKAINDRLLKDKYEPLYIRHVNDYLLIDIPKSIISSHDFCIKMCDDYNIFIKDLGDVLSDQGLYNAVRLAINNPKTNDIVTDRIVNCLDQLIISKLN